jgi:very-short-patch-repair endonuclease
MEKRRSPHYIIELARKMRNNLTPSEKIVWNEIKEKKISGYKFRKQHPVYRYILDFYCHEKKLAIEIDGDSHKERKDYDEYRDSYVRSIGIETLRFTNEEIENNIANVIEAIKKKLSE